MRATDQIVDELLVINGRQGDQKALELLVKRWNYKIIRRIYVSTKDHDASKDLAQDCWITIIEKIKTLKDPAAFEWWALRIATRKSVDWIRKNQLHRNREESRKMIQSEFSEESESKEALLGSLNTAIKELPAEQEQIIQMFYLEELGIIAISRILEIPPGTVKSRLFKARERLKKLLDKQKTEL